MIKVFMPLCTALKCAFSPVMCCVALLNTRNHPLTVVYHIVHQFLSFFCGRPHLGLLSVRGLEGHIPCGSCLDVTKRWYGALPLAVFVCVDPRRNRSSEKA